MTDLIHIDRISFAFPARKVIDDLSITLESGQFYGIIGPNGCGKTTLIDLIINHRQPDSGHIEYNGRELASYSRKTLSREMALVPQNFYINFPFTAREVVMMGRYPHMRRFAAPGPEDRERVAEVMALTETSAFADRLVTQLSGGERQRVIFARALAQDSSLLILDEATSNLDVNHGLSLLKIAARGIGEGQKTVIAVLQDINLAALFCDYLIFIQAGRVADHGPVAQILNADTLRSVFQVESKVYFDSYSESVQVVFKK